jgi:hypothetical protein
LFANRLEKRGMARKAIGREILVLLSERSGEMRTLLGEPLAQLSMPTDGKGLRVVAAVPHPRVHAVVVLRLTLAVRN